jgi:hypothetical protein
VIIKDERENDRGWSKEGHAATLHPWKGLTIPCNDTQKSSDKKTESQ